jgi:hypothetical protein
LVRLLISFDQPTGNGIETGNPTSPWHCPCGPISDGTILSAQVDAYHPAGYATSSSFPPWKYLPGVAELPSGTVDASYSFSALHQITALPIDEILRR